MIIEVPASLCETIFDLCLQTITKSNEKIIVEIRDFIRIELFKISNLSIPLGYFIKEVVDIKNDKVLQIEFKGVPPEHYAVCYKHYHQLPLDDRDLRISWEIVQKNNSWIGDYILLNTESLNLLKVIPWSRKEHSS